jgi:hypothetical protein
VFAVAASPSDLNFQRILTVLSNLRAGPEESLAIISAYTNRPAAEPADPRRVNPSRNQNRKRTVACSDLGPPVCSTGDNPLPGLPVPNMRFNIEVD